MKFVWRISLIIAILAAGFAVATPITYAQSPDCWQEFEDGYITVLNPFTRQLIEIPRMREVFDESCLTINDGRVNHLDKAAEAAIYCTNNGIEVYDLDWSGNGTFLFRTTFAELDQVPTVPAENTLIEGAPGFGLYRLTSGELQLNGPADWQGKPYVFIWNGCDRPQK